MSSLLPAPEGATCASHPEALANWTCGRCGSFMCPACERRVRPEALPMCVACWELRSRTVAQQQDSDSGITLLNVGLGLGLVSLFPFCVAIQLASFVVNIVALVRARTPPARALRWRAWLGLGLTGLGLLVTLVMMWH
ncbi:hypothetical protein F0U60_45670 [Archangium minus]|uniref:B box-type domain-containing protein n=1 Tax=Archangium minus TaxID=83450 RepID=A0ABY9X5D8_9BACT|nr:hypothetical protein F0U60_45670 [Archangium minus]